MLYLAIEWVDFFHGGLLNYQMVIILMMNGQWDMKSRGIMKLRYEWDMKIGRFLEMNYPRYRQYYFVRIEVE